MKDDIWFVYGVASAVEKPTVVVITGDGNQTFYF